MDIKIRIIEILPKLKQIKSNDKDIISMSFNSNNIFLQLEDIGKSILSEEDIVLSLRTKDQIIKLCLLKNKNNILGEGEFVPKEGLKWYELKPINYKSRESLFTSSTSKDNIKMNSKAFESFKHEEITKNGNKGESFLNDSSSLNKIKVKLLIEFCKRKIFSKGKNKNTKRDNIKKNKEVNLTSYKEDDSKTAKKVNYMMTDSNINKLKYNNGLYLSNKKFTNNNGIQKNIIINQKLTYPAIKEDDFRKKIFQFPSISSTTKNNEESPNKKSKKLKNRRMFSNEQKMKTSVGLSERTKLFDKKELSESIELIRKKSDNNMILTKKMSNDLIEDQIIDQNFKNNIKNDEILGISLSKNESFSSSIQNLSQNKSIQGKNLLEAKDSQVSKKNNKINYDIDNTNEKFKKSNQEINSNFVLGDKNINKKILVKRYDSLKSNGNDKNIDEFEDLKNSFIQLYVNNDFGTINQNALYLEVQLMIEKVLKLQYIHQKKFINIINEIKENELYLQFYANKYIQQNKLINRLNEKITSQKMKTNKHNNLKDIMRNYKIRNIMISKGEFFILNDTLNKNWNNTEFNIKNGNIIKNIFLDICSKNKNRLEKLYLNLYKKISKTSNKQFSEVNSHQRNKLDDLWEMKTHNCKSNSICCDKDMNSSYLKTRQNIIQNNTFNIQINTKKRNEKSIKIKKSTINNTKIDTNKRKKMHPNCSAQKIKSLKSKYMNLVYKINRRKKNPNLSQ